MGNIFLLKNSSDRNRSEFHAWHVQNQWRCFRQLNVHIIVNKTWGLRGGWLVILRPRSTLPHIYTHGGESSQSAVVACNVIIARRLSLSPSHRKFFFKPLACLFAYRAVVSSVRSLFPFQLLLFSCFSVYILLIRNRRLPFFVQALITYRRCSTKSLSSGDFSRNSVYVCLESRS